MAFMKRFLLLAVAMFFVAVAYSQDVYPLFRKCSTFKESSVAFRDEFARAYNNELKELKKRDKDGFNSMMKDFKDIVLTFRIGNDGVVELNEERMAGKVDPAQYRVLSVALMRLPAWTPWQHRMHKNNLGVTFPLKHNWHKGY